MPFMQWTVAMSVGVPELDADHQVLIKIINELEANAEDQTRQSVVRQALYALLRYAEYHFGREEKVLAACNYLGLDEHKKEHRAFIQKMRGTADRFDADPEREADVISKELLTFLKDWLNHHILIEDMAYRPLAESNIEAKKAAKSFSATEIWWSR